MSTHLERLRAVGLAADKLIARLPVRDRRRVLEAVVASSHGWPVLIECSTDRRLDGATKLLARLDGVAYTPGGQVVDTLVVTPASSGRRMVAISSAHVLRISAATQLDKPLDPFVGPWDDAEVPYRLGEVLAGPTRGVQS